MNPAPASTLTATSPRPSADTQANSDPPQVVISTSAAITTLSRPSRIQSIRAWRRTTGNLVDTAVVSAYAVTTHDNSDASPSSPTIVGIAVPTMNPSSIDNSRPNITPSTGCWHASIDSARIRWTGCATATDG